MRNPKIGHLLGMVMAIAMVTPPVAGTEQDPLYDFNIPAQSLAEALAAVATQTGLQVLGDGKALEGRRAPAVNGRYNRREVLDRLLSQSGLHYTLTGANAVAIKPENADSSSKGDASPLPEMTVTANRLATTGYTVRNALTATKTDTPIMETPVSIQVVPQQVLRDQQVIRLNRAVENVSGVYRGSFGGDLGVDHFIIRGFQTDVIYRDGMPVDSSTFYGNREVANVDQIEVLKGPASILFGRSEPGGIVSTMTKKPLPSRYYSFGQQFGSFDFYRTTMDATGPITADDSLQYRANLAWEKRGSFRDFAEKESVFIAPTLRWNISERTQATLEFEFRHDSDPFTYGWPVIGNRPAKLPRNFNVGGSLGTNMEAEGVLASLQWSHAFNNHWTLQHRFLTELVDTDTGITVSPGDLEANGRTLPRSFFNLADARNERYFTSLNLTGNFGTGFAQHTLLLGGDYHRNNQSAVTRLGTLPPINDIFNPIFSNSLPAFDPGTFPYAFNTEWYGLYLQDQIKLPYGLHVLAGFRYDNVTNFDDLENLETEASDQVTPRGGVLWQPIPALAFYGSYSEHFGAQSFGTTAAGTATPPESAQQWEFGVKTELWDKRLTGSLAYFDLTKQQVAIPDPNNLLFSIPVGEVNNSGVELDIAGEVLPGWRIIGAYSYIDSEITKSNDTTEGNRLANVPRHGGSLWTSYEVNDGPYRGLRFAGGVVARSERQGDNEGSFQLPGYAAVNLMVGYDWRIGRSKLSLQFNVDNLLDKYYFGSAGFNRSRVNIAAPRTFLGSLRLEF